MPEKNGEWRKLLKAYSKSCDTKYGLLSRRLKAHERNVSRKHEENVGRFDQQDKSIEDMQKLLFKIACGIIVTLLAAMGDLIHTFILHAK